MNFVFLDDCFSGRQRLYTHPKCMIIAHDVDEVEAALLALDVARKNGSYLAGYFSYELGYALEPKLRALLKGKRATPLICFGVFEAYENKMRIDDESVTIEQIAPDWSFEDYKQRFNKAKAYISAGDVYQINITFPMRARARGSALGVYNYLKAKQPVAYGGVIQLCGDTVISLSPEQFFKVQGGDIVLRPMKGTIRRGANARQDLALKHELATDPKSQAENLMIVDLLRNDVSRIAVPGSVQVSDLFTIESYPSLHTMTSGVKAKLRSDLTVGDWVKALFPCGSVTGAPKIRAMEIISELEGQPRDNYCGAIGYFDPNGDASMSVAIRTLSLAKSGHMIYGVGGGVIADSTARSEYDEARLKAKVLFGSFELIETMGWHSQTGFMHLELHLERLTKSAKALGFSINEAAIIDALDQSVCGKKGAHRARLTLARAGEVSVQTHPFVPEPSATVWPIAISQERRNALDPLLIHKTTLRSIMDADAARARKQSGCRELIFINQKGEVCEGSYTNVFMRRGDQLVTPPLTCGLLPGILRRVLIETGEAVEGVITLDEFVNAEEIYVGNGLRGLIRARLVNTPD